MNNKIKGGIIIIGLIIVGYLFVSSITFDWFIQEEDNGLVFAGKMILGFLACFFYTMCLCLATHKVIQKKPTVVQQLKGGNEEK